VVKYNDDYYKISYMTSTHAILFLSTHLWSHMMTTLSQNINKIPIEPIDVHIARIQSQFNIYAVSKPFFYQNTDVNNHLTLYPIEQFYNESQKL